MKIYPAFLAAFFLSNLLSAQESSIRISVGYGVSSGSDKLHENYTATSTVNSTEGVYGSHGAGTNLQLTYTKMFNSTFGLDISARYLLGREFTGTSHSSTGGGSLTTISTSRSGGLFLSPSLILRGEEKKFTPYAKFGFALGFVSVGFEDDVVSISPGITDQTSHIRREDAGGVSFGLSGGGGVIYKTGKKINFFAEILLTGMTFYPDEENVTEYSVNGADMLGTLSVGAKKTVFKREISGPGSSDPNEPSESLQEALPFGNASLNFGIAMRIGGK